MNELETVNLIKCHISNSVLRDCRIQEENGSFCTLENALNKIKSNFLSKIIELQFELKNKDKVIDTLIGLLIQKNVIESDDLEEYIKSQEILKKLSEE